MADDFDAPLPQKLLKQFGYDPCTGGQRNGGTPVKPEHAADIEKEAKLGAIKRQKTETGPGRRIRIWRTSN
jgi:hypothetical protein